MKTHLITGGSGFVGSLVARRLAERGADVRVLDTWDDPRRPDRIRFHKASILDRDAVRDAMRGVDVVHHAAALVAQTDAGPRFWDVNVEGTRIVAEEAVRAKVEAVVHVSTTAVYGLPPETAIDAATPLAPVEPYGRSKLAGETLMGGICRDHGIPLVTIRPRATLGAGRLGIFQILFDWVRSGSAVTIVGSGRQRMQFVHADDLLEFYLLALDRARFGTFNVGTDRFGTLEDDLTDLIRHAGSASRIRRVPAVLAVNALRAARALRVSPFVPWHYLTYHRSCHFDVAPLLALGWRPRFSNAEMLRDSFDWFLANEASDPGTAGSPHRSPLRQGLLGLATRRPARVHAGRPAIEAAGRGQA